MQRLGHEPDQVPMPSDIEWHFASGGLQLVTTASRLVQVASRLVLMTSTPISRRSGTGTGRTRGHDGAFRTVPIAVFGDPDGNIVVLGQTLTS